MPKLANAPARLAGALALVETALLVLLLTAMVTVAVYQVAARSLFGGGGLVWGSDLVHVAMLWATMVGAVSAARANRHIKIDLLARFAGPAMRLAAERLTSAFAAVLCGALGWFSLDFIRWDFIDGTPGVGAVPAWVCEAIIPLAAGVMALDYLARAVWPGREGPVEADAGGAAGAPGPAHDPRGDGKRDDLAP